MNEVTIAETQQILIFNVAKEKFAADIDSVREVIRLEKITPVPNSGDYIEGIINIRGKIVPVIHLASLMNLGKDEECTYIIMLDLPDSGLVGMAVGTVDQIKRINRSEIKEAPKLVRSRVSSEFISGVILPEGESEAAEVILFVDLKAVITSTIAKAITKVTGDTYSSIKKTKES
jgi:chemotaxis signal transduction protein